MATAAFVLMSAAANASTSNNPIQALTDAINARGLEEFRSVPLAGFHDRIAVSPVMRWYTRFIVATGSARPPSSKDNTDALALTRALAAKSQRLIRSHIWVDSEGTSYGTVSADLLRSAISAPTTTLHWALDSDDAAPVDNVMQAWLLKNDIPQARDANGAHGFIEALDFARYSNERNNHPFNALTILADTTQFGSRTTVQSYGVDGIDGIRVDDPQAKSIIYLFYGDVPAIQRLQQSLNPSFVVNLDDQFHGPAIIVSALDVSGADFFNPDAERSFSTWLNRPNQESGEDRVRFHMDRHGMFLSTLTGIEGQGGDPNAPLVDTWRLRLRRFDSPRPLICLVIDKATHVILFVGGTITTKH